MKIPRKTATYILIAILGARALAVSAVPAGEIHLNPPAIPIPPQFFGMHFHRITSSTTWPEGIDVHTWRLLGTYIMWPNMQPQKGPIDFAVLNRLVDLAEQHHTEVFMPLVLSPPWASARPTEPSAYSPGNAAEPKDIADWQNYVHEVASNYKGRIHYYEIWNEPNAKNFWSGSIPKLVELACTAYSTLKAVDPSIQVSSPPPTTPEGVTYFDQYLKAGGGKCADIIGYHLYVSPRPPEAMVPLIQQVKQIMSRNGVADKPLWNTESGWPIQNKQSIVKPTPGKGYMSIVLPEDEGASYLARAFVLAWASGVSRFYWYSWDNYILGLVDHDGKTLKSPAIAFREIQKWLVGARMDSCDSDANGTWTCAISREGGYRGWIVWNPDGRRTFSSPIPAQWNVKKVRDLLGHDSNLAPGGKFNVSVMPHLLEAPGR